MCTAMSGRARTTVFSHLPHMLPCFKSPGATQPSQPTVPMNVCRTREGLPLETSLFAAYLGLLDELGDDHRVLLGDGCCAAQEALQVPISVGHVHSSATQHIGGAHHAGVPHSLAELASRLRVQGA